MYASWDGLQHFLTPIYQEEAILTYNVNTGRPYYHGVIFYLLRHRPCQALDTVVDNL